MGVQQEAVDKANDNALKEGEKRYKEEGKRKG